jgi:RNA polymerase sigma-70 factor (ECF subfamily)
VKRVASDQALSRAGGGARPAAAGLPCRAARDGEPQAPHDDERRATRDREPFAAHGGATRDDEPRTFEALYRQHVGRVYALCLRLTGRADVAEEVTQDTFVHAWQRLDGFRGDSAFATWLHRLAVNSVFDRWRAQRSWLRRATPLEDADDATLSHAPPDAERLDLENAIRALPRGARTVFVLHDVEGWQHDEIAARCGIAVGTSKAHLHRARQLLKERLQ